MPVTIYLFLFIYCPIIHLPIHCDLQDIHSGHLCIYLFTVIYRISILVIFAS